MKLGFILSCVLGCSFLLGCSTNGGNPAKSELGDQAGGRKAAEHIRDLITGNCEGKPFIWDLVTGQPIPLKEPRPPVDFVVDEIPAFDHLYGIEARGTAIIGQRKELGVQLQEMYKQNGDWFIRAQGNQQQWGAVKVDNLQPVPTDCREVLEVIKHF